MPCGPINTSTEVFADPQVQARGMRVDLPHPRRPPARSPLSPARSSGATRPPTARRRRRSGEHTDEVLEELLGLDAAERQRLREAGVIG